MNSGLVSISAGSSAERSPRAAGVNCVADPYAEMLWSVVPLGNSIDRSAGEMSLETLAICPPYFPDANWHRAEF
jgi:hypothetical protein